MQRINQDQHHLFSGPVCELRLESGSTQSPFVHACLEGGEYLEYFNSSHVENGPVIILRGSHDTKRPRISTTLHKDNDITLYEFEMRADMS